MSRIKELSNGAPRKDDFAFKQYKRILEENWEKDLRLTVIESIFEGKEWGDKFQNLADSLDAYFDFTILGVKLISSTSDKYEDFTFLKHDSGKIRRLTPGDFCKMAGISRKEYFSLLKEQEALYNAPAIYQGDEYGTVPFKFHQIARETFDLNSGLFYPIRIPGFGKAVFKLLSNKNYAYRKEDLTIIERIIPAITLSFTQVLSKFEIQELKNKYEEENKYLVSELNLQDSSKLVGSSSAMQEVFEKIHQVATGDTTVLITGETGTGKELVADALHRYSSRQDKVFVKINCAALPAEVLESELFGHEKGSFTGAYQQRIGKFEYASGGTIFLDEIGELPLSLQAKLLRVIQEKEFERIGGNKSIKTNFRLITATNRDLFAAVKADRFRADLFYRLHVFPIHIPPLRERREDIPQLAAHFLAIFNKKLGKSIKGLTNSAISEMEVYDWPGNVRELQNLIERATIVSQGSIASLDIPLCKKDGQPMPSEILEIEPLVENEKNHILKALKISKGKVRGKGGAAELLQINASTLNSRIKKLGIEKGFH